MQLEWYGQSAFRLTRRRARRSSSTRSTTCPRMQRPRPALGLPADRGRERRPAARHPRAPRPQRRRARSAATRCVVRSTAGTPRVAGRRGRRRSRPSTTTVAGTQRGPNTLFVFSLRRDARRAPRRPRPDRAARRAARGARPGRPAARARRRRADDRRRRRRWRSSSRCGAQVVVPTHYRTERIDFLEPVDAFAERFATRAPRRRPGGRPRRAAGRRRAGCWCCPRCRSGRLRAPPATSAGRANRAGWPVDSSTDSHRSPSGSTVLRRADRDGDRDVDEAAVPAADDHLGAPGHRRVDGGVGEPDAVDAVVRVGRARCGSRSSGRVA